MRNNAYEKFEKNIENKDNKHKFISSIRNISK